MQLMIFVVTHLLRKVAIMKARIFAGGCSALLVGAAFLMATAEAEARGCRGGFQGGSSTYYRGSDGPIPFSGAYGEGPCPVFWGGDGPQPFGSGMSYSKRPSSLESGRRVSLTFQENGTRSDYYVNVYLKHPDGIYRPYAGHLLKAASPALVAPEAYYVTDELMFHVYLRGFPGAPWSFQRASLKTIYGPGGVFHPATGDIIYPTP